MSPPPLKLHVLSWSLSKSSFVSGGSRMSIVRVTRLPPADLVHLPLSPPRQHYLLLTGTDCLSGDSRKADPNGSLLHCCFHFMYPHVSSFRSINLRTSTDATSLLSEVPRRLSLSFSLQTHLSSSICINPTPGACGSPLRLQRPDPNSQKLIRPCCYRTTSDVICGASASHLESRVATKPLVGGPSSFSIWAWPSITVAGNWLSLSQPKPIILNHNKQRLDTGLGFLTSSLISEGLLGIYILRLLSYHSVKMKCSMGSSTLSPMTSSSSNEESISLPCLFSMKGDVSSSYLPSVYFNFLTGLSLYVADCTGPDGAIEKTLVFLVGEGWLLTSQCKVTKSLMSDFIVKTSSTHPNLVLNPLSTFYEELSYLILLAIIAYVYSPKGRKIPFCYCSSLS